MERGGHRRRGRHHRPGGLGRLPHLTRKAPLSPWPCPPPESPGSAARGGRAPAIFLGVFFTLELILNFTIFGVLGDLQHQGSWTDFSTGLGYTAASLAGLSACLALTGARTRDDRNARS